MATDLAVRTNGTADMAQITEQVLATGDLEKLTPAQRVAHYLRVCESLGLNHLTQPFQYIRLSGRLTFYATRGATDQLRDLKGVSVVVTDRQRIDDLYVVTARATLPGGRTDESIGAVSIKGLAGEALANALMKAETKAKRRVTLSACGLGWADESEVGSTPGASLVQVNQETGEITGESRIEPSAHPLAPQMEARHIEGVKDNAGPIKPASTIHVIDERGEPVAVDESQPAPPKPTAEEVKAQLKARVEELQGLALAEGVELPDVTACKNLGQVRQWIAAAEAALPEAF